MSPLLVAALAAAALRVGVVGADEVAANELDVPANVKLVPQKVMKRARAELDERGGTCGEAVACAASLGAWARLDQVVLVDHDGGGTRTRLVDVGKAVVLFAANTPTTEALVLRQAIEAALWQNAARLPAAVVVSPVVPPVTPPVTPPVGTTPPLVPALPAPTTPIAPTPTPTPTAPITEESSASSPLWAAGIGALGGGGALAVVAGAGALVLLPSEAAYRNDELTAGQWNTRQDYAVAAVVVAGLGLVIAAAGGVAALVSVNLGSAPGRANVTIEAEEAGAVSPTSGPPLSRFSGLVADPRTREVFATLKDVAASEATVIIEGETGTDPQTTGSDEQI